jgi:multiple sugar transport system substrate-binding protein
MPFNFKRWTALLAYTTITICILVGCGSGSGGGTNNANGSAAATTKPFAGKTLSIYLANHPWVDNLRTLVPEFEAQTGMKVDIQSFPLDQQVQKLTVQLTGGATAPDVMYFTPLQDGKKFFKNGWLLPLDEYVKKSPQIDFEDFSKPSVASISIDNKLAGIPLLSEQEILYYRKDLLEKAGLQVPKTLDELEAAAKKLHDPANGFYGFVSRGQRSLMKPASYLFSEGGDFMKDGKATINTPEAISAFTRYANLLKNYGPPGVLNMNWPQAMGLFAQGKVAFYTDANAIYSNAIDPDKSIVKNNVGYALFPAGKAGSKPYNVTSGALGINSQSANKDAAWEFIKWATSKEIMLKEQQKNVPGVRNSVWNSPEGVSGFPAQLIEVIKESNKVGVGYDRPQVINVSEARDAIGDIVTKGVLGEDIKAAADKANQAFQAIIDKEK